MNTNEAKEIIKDSWEEILSQITRPAKTKVNGRTSYICPLCNHGKNGDGITVDPTSKEGNGLKCFGCGFSGDIISLIGEKEGISYFPDQLKRAGEYIGITIDEPGTPRKPFSPLADKRTQQTTAPADQESQVEYCKEAHRHIKETDYLQKRGLSPEVINRFGLGYVDAYPTGGKPWQAIIIPTGKYSFVARNTDPTAEDGNRYRNKGKSTPLNWQALTTATKPIIITEGELDAISIIEAGGEAIGLGSSSNVNLFINDYVKENKPAQPLIIALDNDSTGREATADLEAKLKEIGIYPYRAELYGKCKDANELLIKDREALTRAIQQAEQEAYRHEEERKEEALKAYRGEYSAKAKIQDFINGIADSVNTPAIPTGFTILDKELDGGMYEGLYIIGGISSLGKTTLVMQIADQLADSGKDVLIFSLEMAETELMSKSISRQTLIDTLANSGNIANCKTARGITAGARYEHYSQEEKDLIKRAIEAYSQYAEHIYIKEGVGNIGVKEIKAAVENHISITGEAPVVIIDYLQIISPYNERATDKQNTDKAVTELKRISRDYKTPVIAISSLNRDNYKNEISMQAFKESGSIEYSSDVLIGLQLKGAGNKDFDELKAKDKTPREVELVILKNRNGKTGGKIAYEYYTIFNCFKEKDKVTK